MKREDEHARQGYVLPISESTEKLLIELQLIDHPPGRPARSPESRGR
jgi:hypothetical protein